MLRSEGIPRRGDAGVSAITLLRWAVLWVAATMLAAVSFAVRADEEDLPGRVGRIAEFAGELYLSPEERATDWASIGLNYPVTSGDNLWVSTEGRAEVDYGGGQFRLAGDTNLHVSRLDDRQVALFVAQGRLIVRVRVLDAGDSARIDTPNTQVELTRTGLYRIDVSPDRQVTTVVVREGEALVGLAAGAQQALPGQTVTVVGQDPTEADVRNGVAADGFDTWSANRDRRYERSLASPYVSRQMVGAVELDEYGTWQTDPTYGAVWYPTDVAVDWAPYRDGYWAWSGGWGWTWVDYAPWGYAPFHYGRWAHVGGRWGWCPGAYVARPYWAPALVSWYGGPGWSFSVSYGAPVYGWIPLGWGDRYVPSWGRRECGERCWTHYNRPYAVNHAERRDAPPTRFANAAVPGAITAVAGATLIGAKPVASNRVRLPQQTAGSAPVLATAPAVKPLHIPAAKPGTGGAPPPASTFYPTSRRPAGVGDSARRPLPETSATPAAPGAGAVPGDVRRARDKAGGSAAPITPGTGSVAPTTRTAPAPRVASPVTPAPEGAGRAAAAAPARIESRSQAPRGDAGAVPVPQQQDRQRQGQRVQPQQQEPLQQQQAQRQRQPLPQVQAQPQQDQRQRQPQPQVRTQPQAHQPQLQQQPQRVYIGPAPGRAAPSQPAARSAPSVPLVTVPPQPGPVPRMVAPAPSPTQQGGPSGGSSRSSGQRENPQRGGGQAEEKPGRVPGSSGPSGPR